MIKSSNPALWENIFSSIWLEQKRDWELMTLEWTVNKTWIFLFFVFLGFIVSWTFWSLFSVFILPLVIINLVIWIIIIWKKHLAWTLWFIYSLLEGLTLWVLSLVLEKQFSWIVIQAITGTLWVFWVMLFLYKTKVIQVTENFKLWVTAATWWIIILYLISLFWNITWLYNLPYIHTWGPIWIWLSIFIVWIAALNLIMDFDFIEKWVEEKAPKYMEYYWAFGLIVTLVWLYFEILRLLTKLKSEE